MLDRERPPMPQTYDVLVKGGTLVNHDGAGVRDIGVTAGRIAAIPAPVISSAPLASRLSKVVPATWARSIAWAATVRPPVPTLR